MDNQQYDRLIAIMKKKKVTISEIVASFHVESLAEFADLVLDFINDNKEFLTTTEFFSCYHLFLYNIADIINCEDDFYVVKSMIDRTLKVVKEIVKPYNKSLKSKDEIYYLANRVSSDLKANKEYVEGILNNFQEEEEYQIVWFVLTELKNSDYLFRLVELHPDYVNLKNNNNNCIFEEFISYIVANIKDFSEEDIKKYKRLVILFLESDRLKLNTSKLVSILKYLEDSLISASIDEKKTINFIINEIERHYDVINTDSRLICVDYCHIKSPIDVISRDNDERVDLTNLFTFSIDAIGNNSIDKHLIDDAISIVEKRNNEVDIYIHIPDVDYFIKKDSEIDKFMRSIGESVYAKGYKKPMLDYDIATRCSLSHGNIRPAISFIISLDELGHVKHIDFKKSIINVNWNLSKGYAEYFYNYSTDKKLYDALHLAKRYALLLRKNRGEKTSKVKTSPLIIEETNVLVDIVTADYFKKNGLIFPYKNYLGKKSMRSARDVSLCENFNRDNDISEEGRNILYSIFDIYNRVYYDTVSVGNKAFGGRDVGNVGNPLREYISLETDRLIKDLVISGEHNHAYWEERIERDCLEYTETSAKIKSLYKEN